MNRLSRIAACFVTALLVAVMMPLQASANGPAPAHWYDIYVTDLPEGTVYVDLLIPLPETDPMYTDLEKSNLPATFSETAEIITYCQNGFRSYTFHYRDSLSVIKPRRENIVSFFMEEADVNGILHNRYGHMQDIEERGKIRLAMLDEVGNILKVSPDLQLNTRDLFAFKLGEFYYNGATDCWEIDMHVSALGVCVYIIMSIFGIALTCFIEWLVACAFRLQGYSGLVMKTNLLSQMVMRLGFVLLYGIIFWKYSYVVILLELAVYVCEFFWYRKRMQLITPKKILLYTIVANTASLILGYRLNVMLLYSQ